VFQAGLCLLYLDKIVSKLTVLTCLPMSKHSSLSGRVLGLCPSSRSCTAKQAENRSKAIMCIGLGFGTMELKVC